MDTRRLGLEEKSLRATMGQFNVAIVDRWLSLYVRFTSYELEVIEKDKKLRR